MNNFNFKRSFQFLAVIILAVVFVGCFDFNKKKIKTKNTMMTENDFFGISFPPVKNQKELDFTFTKLQDLGIGKVRFETNWKFREPKRGEFNWDPLDRRIDFFNEHKISVLLTIASDGPEWACGERNEESCVFKSKEDFRKFISMLAKRYANRIDRIQFGNEWEMKFVGSAEEYIEYSDIVYEEVKRNSPQTQFVLGGLTRSAVLYEELCLNETKLDFSKLELLENKTSDEMFSFMKKRMCEKSRDKYEIAYRATNFVLEKARYDLVDLHLYDDAENWQVYVERLKKRTKKPLIVSEFGGPSPDFEIYSDEYQAKRMEVYIKTMQKLSIEEAYYFKLVDSPRSYHAKSGIIFEDGKRHKPAYEVLKRLMNEEKT